MKNLMIRTSYMIIVKTNFVVNPLFNTVAAIGGQPNARDVALSVRLAFLRRV